MTTAYLCGNCGIEQKKLENNAAYLLGWQRQLRDNKKWLIQAAGNAQKAADFIPGLVLGGEGKKLVEWPLSNSAARDATSARPALVIWAVKSYRLNGKNY